MQEPVPMIMGDETFELAQEQLPPGWYETLQATTNARMHGLHAPA